MTTHTTEARPARRLSAHLIALDLGGTVAERIARGTIRALQNMSAGLSGDDTPLRTVWDELCVQQQRENSFYWDSYVEMIETCVDAALEDLKPFERDALWQLTPEAGEREHDEEAEREPYPVFTDDISRYLVEDRILRAATNWSNPRIRRYLDRQYLDDE